MANLDDFFKKKDTKKSKGKKKFAVNNPLSLNNTDGSKNGKPKPEKTTSFNPTLLTNENDLFSSQQTDEWKEFQEEEKKDYSGLKIQNLQVNDNEDGQNSKQSGSEEETEVNEQGETVVKKKSGPWKVLEKKKEEVQPPPVEEKKPPKEETPSDRYVPPSRRHQGFSTQVRRPTPTNKPSDLSNQELFPALSTTVPKSKAK